jgi:hypothetical protein
MSAAALTNVVNPVGDDSRLRRLVKVAGWIAAAAAVFGLLDLLGVDVGGWVSGLWDTLRSVSVGYLVAAVVRAGRPPRAKRPAKSDVRVHAVLPGRPSTRSVCRAASTGRE